MTDFNDLTDLDRPLPVERSFSRPFWDATRERRLLLQYDRVAQAFQFYPRPTSIYTGRASTLEWREVSGEGSIFSYTIARRARPPFRGNEPFWLALVTLDEGVNVMANVIQCAPGQMQIGMRVLPHWAPLSDGRHLLLFRPAQGGSPSG
ncbi:hypothetical protein SLG_35040 [Sphingobium sp. SYK-6]|uniref:Zn-ribbon domain-containing OB-fold protein n=1 Tax=Sphingobium sp. (strain NBRC 103272 / SYK-6) TaxID=627192 RepID=UPI0002277B12|nr:OB-fold domain-containing protein [Sphingobium sp. SYK-6]BAK68179.1 hypothetical protein SLG_35040 [Sphingobium sp. SYK-6]